MHKIAAKEFELDDFSHEHLSEYSKEKLEDLFGWLNMCRTNFNLDKDKEDWWQLIQLLPSSYNQKRTVTMNYENVITIIKQRSGHKLDEWNELINVIRKLPYVEKIMGE